MLRWVCRKVKLRLERRAQVWCAGQSGRPNLGTGLEMNRDVIIPPSRYWTASLTEDGAIAGLHVVKLEANPRWPRVLAV